MALLYASPLFEKHLTGTDPESPQRIAVLLKMLSESGLQNRFQAGKPVAAELKDLQRIHPAEYVAEIQQFAEQGGGRIEPDTRVSPDSFDVARHAVGSAISAVHEVVSGNHTQAVCLIRPPGHHALPERAMGFCLFSNIAIAAQVAIEVHQLNRVLIVDWDVHHGNGTQDIFYKESRVHFFSAHRFPFYPGSGNSDETGAGDGLGATWNLPLAFGISRVEYHEQFSRMLHDAAKKCQPELILLSAGFDAHRDDPIGSLGLETEDFQTLTRTIQQVADEYCGGKLVSLLEGGYNLQALSDSVKVHLEQILAAEVED